MVEDMLPALSFQRIQLSDDPEDYSWVRWYWAKPGAKTFPFLNAYGHQMWEERRGDPAPTILIPLEPRKYAPSRVSPFPGQEFHGLPDWYLDGLPDFARDVSDEPFQCGVNAWDAQTPMSMDPECSVILPWPPVIFYGTQTVFTVSGALIISPYGTMFEPFPDSRPGDVDIMKGLIRDSYLPATYPSGWTVIAEGSAPSMGCHWFTMYRVLQESDFPDNVGWNPGTGDARNNLWVERWIIRGVGVAPAVYSVGATGSVGTVPDIPLEGFPPCLLLVISPGDFPTQTADPIPGMNGFSLDRRFRWSPAWWQFYLGIVGSTEEKEFDLKETKGWHTLASVWPLLDECFPDPPEGMTAEGGDGDGGEADVETGESIDGTGGDADGGVADVATGQSIDGTGGDADGGVADVATGQNIDGTGGDADGGVADVATGQNIDGTGGDADGGVADVATGP